MLCFKSIIFRRNEDGAFIADCMSASGAIWEKKAGDCNDRSSSVYRRERVIRNGLADNLADKGFMSFRRLQRMNLEFLSKEPRAPSLRDRWQTTVLNHGTSRAAIRCQ